jgi:hypothetical protein
MSSVVESSWKHEELFYPIVKQQSYGRDLDLDVNDHGTPDLGTATTPPSTTPAEKDAREEHGTPDIGTPSTPPPARPATPDAPSKW